MSSRGRAQNIRTSQIYLPMDNTSLPSTPTSSEEDREHHWSDVVPPKAALTFAVLWDPEEGMVTFSGPQLLETDSSMGSTCNSIFEDKALQEKACEGGAESTDEDATPPLRVRAFLHRSLRYRQECGKLSRTSSTHENRVALRRDTPLRSARSLHIPRAKKVEASIPEHDVVSPSAPLFRSRTEHTPKKGGFGEQSPIRRYGTLLTHFSPTPPSGVSPKVLTRGAPPSAPTLKAPWPRLFALPSEIPTTPRRRLHKRPPESEDRNPVPFAGARLWTGLDAASPKPNPGERKPLSFLSRSPSKSTPPVNTLSKSSSIKDKFPIFPRRMASLRTNNAADKGWVYVEVNTTIRQRYLPDLDEE